MSSSPVGARLARLAERFDLPEQAPAQLERLLDLVATDPLAPTTVRDPAAALDAHVADALVALELDPVRAARRIADLGSGAGFPGLVLAVQAVVAVAAIDDVEAHAAIEIIVAADFQPLHPVVDRTFCA